MEGFRFHAETLENAGANYWTSRCGCYRATNKLQPLPHYSQGQFHSIDEAVQAANVKDTTIIRLQDVIPLPKIAVKVKVIEPS